MSVPKSFYKYLPFLVLIVVFLFFALLAPSGFASVRNLETIARQASIVSCAALGMTVVVIAGGIDLSVGSLVALVTVLIAHFLELGYLPSVAIIAALCGALVAGLFNALIITRLKVMPFIVTLGTLLIFRGVAKGLAHEQKIDAPISWLNELLSTLPAQDKWQIFPAGVWLTIILALALAIVLKRTTFGRYVYAIGSNQETARISGINVERIKCIVYVLSAAFAGVAGLLQFSRLTVGDPTVAIGLELDVVAAVVIGGGSLNGGQGSIAGTIVGALLMTVIRSGCSQIGLPNWIQEMVTGMIIVLAVVIDRIRSERN